MTYPVFSDLCGRISAKIKMKLLNFITLVSPTQFCVRIPFSGFSEISRFRVVYPFASFTFSSDPIFSEKEKDFRLAGLFFDTLCKGSRDIFSVAYFVRMT